MHLSYLFKILGKKTISFIKELGKMACFLAISLYYMILPPYLINRVIKQVHFIGVKTILVIGLTGLFTGMVLSLQTYYVLVTFGAESKLGAILSVSLIRELGPVIAALMVIGRAGSALTAEIGIMRISEQIDALDAMALNPYKYLVIPNLLAGLISLPILTAMFIVVGIWGGYLVGVTLTGLSSGVYFGAIADSILAKDVLLSLYKSLCFGVLITWVSCFKGFRADHGSGFGAEGVSRATTQAVVLSSVLVLVFDYYITSIMMFV
ncbi:MAG: MlaE family lipid ABC transporter permease subunit [Candidatus Saelkia tenebricola]|nr:MlaE family lipid ABC transporter permease subunit [Candidatus Saelkia tenebricola]